MQINKCRCRVSCRPMLLSYIEDLINSPIMQKGGNEYRIYDALIDSWLRREQTKKVAISKEDLYAACIILAVWMQTRLKREITELELDQLVGEISKVKPITRIDMKGRSLLSIRPKIKLHFNVV